MTLIRQMSEIVGQKKKIFQFRGGSFGPARFDSKFNIVVSPASLGDSSCQAHGAPAHLMRQSKTLAFRPSIRGSV